MGFLLFTEFNYIKFGCLHIDVIFLRVGNFAPLKLPILEDYFEELPGLDFVQYIIGDARDFQEVFSIIRDFYWFILDDLCLNRRHLTHLITEVLY
jgi:hypothetical protein